MDQLENLHYAIGQIAFAIAISDESVQKEEHDRFQNIVKEELRNHDFDFDISEIIFKIMEKEKMDSETLYSWAMKQIKLNSNYLSPELKAKFISVAEKIAKTCPSKDGREIELVNRFKKDLADIHGDPVYYK